MNRYPDETLNHWADVYVNRHVRKHGVSLEVFLAYPHAVLARIDRIEAANLALDDTPHLRQRDQRAEHDLRQRWQLLMQKLWHGSRRRNRADAPIFTRRKRK